MQKTICRTVFIGDEPSNIDELANQPHNLLAETIKAVINNEPIGKTIGLEGKWGSGKSTVLKILKMKLENDDRYKIITFDAWAHQGNPLRKSFLKELINELFDNEDTLSKCNDETKIIIDKLDHVYSEKTQTEELNLSCKEIFAGILLFFIFPIGLIFLTKGIDNGIFYFFNGNYNFEFLLGLFLTFLPLLFSCISKPEVYKDIILNREVTRKVSPFTILFKIFPKTTKIISYDDPETSSYEFERYFLNILKNYFSIFNKKKLIIIFDNLDRVDNEDAKNLLSTLQIFLGDNFSKHKEEYKKLWVIIPFDPYGNIKKSSYLNLNKEGDDANKQQDKNGNIEYINSPIEKRFNFVFKIPPIQILNIQEYFYNKLEQAFPDHNKDHFYNTYSLFINSFNEKLFEITPRNIIFFINQLSTFHLNFCKLIPLPHIAYYLCEQANIKLKLDQIRKGEFNKNNEYYLNLLGSDLPFSITLLHYNLIEKIPHEILLFPEFEKNFSLRNVDYFKNSLLKGNENFWPSLDRFLSTAWFSQDKNNIFSCSYILYELRNYSNEKIENNLFIKDIISRMMILANSLPEWNPLDIFRIESISRLLDLVSKKEFYENSLKKVSSTISLDEPENPLSNPAFIKEVEERIDNWVNLLLIIIKKGQAGNIKVFPESPLTLFFQPYTYFEFLSALMKYDPEKEFEKYFVYAKSDDKLTDGFIGIINSNSFTNKYSNVISYLIRTESQLNWENIINAIVDRLRTKDLPNLYVYHLALELISNGISNFSQSLSNYINSSTIVLHHFYSAFNSKDINAAALCLLFYLKFSKTITNPPPLEQNQQGFSLLEKISNNPDSYEELIQQLIIFILERKEIAFLIAAYLKNPKFSGLIKYILIQISKNNDSGLIEYKFLKENYKNIRALWN